LERGVGFLLLQEALRLNDLDARGAGRQDQGQNVIRIERDGRHDNAQLVGGEQTLFGRSRSFLLAFFLCDWGRDRVEHQKPTARRHRPPSAHRLYSKLDQAAHNRSPAPTAKPVPAAPKHWCP